MAVAFDLGIVAREPAPAVVDLCVEAEALGFDGLWIADSQSVFRDAFALLGVAAVKTSRVLLSTGVTNPVTRHPAVLAGAFATLAELARGRVVLTFGRGESAVRTLGLRPATTARMEEAVHVLRALLAGETTTWEGHEIKMAWQGPPVPVYVAASGPRTLRLAGRVADGVLFQVGADPRLVQWAIDQVEAGAREAGRALADVTLCARVGCSIGDDREQAREEMKPYAAVAANTSFDAIPDEELPRDVLEQAEELRARYDYYEHAHGDAKHRVLVTDAVMDTVAIAGTPDEAVPRFRTIAALGVDRIVTPVVVPDGLALARNLSSRVVADVVG